MLCMLEMGMGHNGCWNHRAAVRAGTWWELDLGVAVGAGVGDGLQRMLEPLCHGGCWRQSQQGWWVLEPGGCGGRWTQGGGCQWVPWWVPPWQCQAQRAPAAVCSGELTDTAGVVLSPNWPEAYGKGQDCIWGLHVEEDKRVMLDVRV